jgi:hypothetical protein
LIGITDTIFQTDPFTREFTQKTLPLSTECTIYGRCVWNRDWIQRVDPGHVKQYLPKPVVNSGLIVGSIVNVMRLLALIVSLPDYQDFDTLQQYPWGIDQGFLGMLVYRGFFRDAGINGTLMNRSSPFASLFRCKFALHQSDNEPITRNGTGVTLSIIHQYNRYPYLIGYTQRNCPNVTSTGQYRAAYAEPKQIRYG